MSSRSRRPTSSALPSSYISFVRSRSGSGPRKERVLTSIYEAVATHSIRDGCLLPRPTKRSRRSARDRDDDQHTEEDPGDYEDDNDDEDDTSSSDGIFSSPPLAPVTSIASPDPITTATGPPNPRKRARSRSQSQGPVRGSRQRTQSASRAPSIAPSDPTYSPPPGAVSTRPMPDHSDLLPDADLLAALHTYASTFYSKAYLPPLEVKEAEIDYRSMDETALMAMGVVLEEMCRSTIGRTGDLAFTEAPEGIGAVDEDLKEDEEDENDEEESEDESDDASGGASDDEEDGVEDDESENESVKDQEALSEDSARDVEMKTEEDSPGEESDESGDYDDDDDDDDDDDEEDDDGGDSSSDQSGKRGQLEGVKETRVALQGDALSQMGSQRQSNQSQTASSSSSEEEENDPDEESDDNS